MTSGEGFSVESWGRRVGVDDDRIQLLNCGCWSPGSTSGSFCDIRRYFGCQLQGLGAPRPRNRRNLVQCCPAVVNRLNSDERLTLANLCNKSQWNNRDRHEWEMCFYTLQVGAQLYCLMRDVLIGWQIKGRGLQWQNEIDSIAWCEVVGRMNVAVQTIELWNQLAGICCCHILGRLNLICRVIRAIK